MFALGKLNLLGDVSLIDQVNQGDIMEVHDGSYSQLYRSYSFFKHCRYSLVDLSTYPWFELYERSSTVTKQLIEATEKLLGSQSGRVSMHDYPEYTLRELMTEERATFALKEKYGVRLVSPTTGEYYILSVKSVRELQSDLRGVPGNVRFL